MVQLLRIADCVNLPNAGAAFVVDVSTPPASPPGTHDERGPLFHRIRGSLGAMHGLARTTASLDAFSCTSCPPGELTSIEDHRVADFGLEEA
jgi:hypothetical protein